MQVREKLHAAGLPLCESHDYREAMAEGSRRRKLLLVLIHSDFHSGANSFLTDVFLKPKVVAIIRGNFLVWTTPVTSPEGFRYFNDAGGTIFPFLTVNCRTSGGDRVLRVLQGIPTAHRLQDELLDVIAQNAEILTKFRRYFDESKSRVEIRQEITKELDKTTHVADKSE